MTDALDELKQEQGAVALGVLEGWSPGDCWLRACGGRRLERALAHRLRDRRQVPGKVSNCFLFIFAVLGIELKHSTTELHPRAF